MNIGLNESSGSVKRYIREKARKRETVQSNTAKLTQTKTNMVAPMQRDKAREKYKTVHRERGENHLNCSVSKARHCMVRGSSLRVDLPQRLCMERGSSLSVDL